MKAIGLYRYLPIKDPESLIDIEIEKPIAKHRDILVAVKAIAVNPVDTKIRAPKEQVETNAKILGWDAAGEVIAVGDAVKDFKVGDQVFYAGDVTRSGCNAEYQLVDERLVAVKPTSLDYAEAAALPLTSITAWESMFDRLSISTTGEDSDKSILIIGGAGGVGSIAIQLAKKVAKLKVIATASRDDTNEWVRKFGADEVISHRKSIDEELKNIGINEVDYILCLNSTEQHWEAMAGAIVPQGSICCIVDAESPINVNLLKPKSASLVWEFMFTRAMFKTDDMCEQGRVLSQISEMVDSGLLSTTLKQVISPINAANLRQVHADIEAGNSIGKHVLSNWL